MRHPTERVRFKVQNLDWATGWRRDRELLQHLAANHAGLPVILLLQEAKNLLGMHTVGKLLGRAFRGLTGTDPATAGSAIYAYGVRVRGLHLWLLGKFTGTLPRWCTQGHVHLVGGACRVISAHIPPKRSGRRQQRRALDKLVRHAKRAEAMGWAWIIGADFNMRLVEVRRYFREHGVEAHIYGEDHGHGIVGFIVSPRVRVSDHGEDRYGLRHDDTDHPGEWIDVHGLRPALRAV